MIKIPEKIRPPVPYFPFEANIRMNINSSVQADYNFVSHPALLHWWM